MLIKEEKKKKSQKIMFQSLTAKVLEHIEKAWGDDAGVHVLCVELVLKSRDGNSDTWFVAG